MCHLLIELKFCVFVLAVSSCSIALAVDAAEYYVVPNNSTENVKSQNCQTLDYYAAKPNTYFRDNSTFYFLPGEHVLDDGQNITVQNVSGIRLTLTNNQSACGYTPQNNETAVVIDCRKNQAGFSFIYVAQLEMSGIQIRSCGIVLYNQTFNTTDNKHYIDHWSATIALTNVTDFVLLDSYIEDSHGYAIFGRGVYGNSTIKRCHFKGNRAEKNGTNEYVQGGNIALRYNGSCPISSYFEISDSMILNGYSASYGAGLDLILNCNDQVITLVLDTVHIYYNTGYGSGEQLSSVAIQLLALPDNYDTNSITFTNCTIGHTYFIRNIGNALNVAVYVHSKWSALNKQEEIVQVITFKGTWFVNNTSGVAGSAVHMRLYDSGESIGNKIGIVFNDTHFENNYLRTDRLKQSSGIAVDIVLFRAGGSSLHSVPQFYTKFYSCVFKHNHILNHPSFGSGALYVEEHSDVGFENCTISDNNCTGIAAVHSSLRFKGNNSITGNKAQSGGGIMLVDNSVLLLTAGTTLLIANNKVNDAGGGIYAEYGTTSAIPICFFQFDTQTLLSNSKLKTIRVKLENNNATIGKALYGGHIDTCYFLVNNTPWINKQVLHEQSGDIFNHTFLYDKSEKLAISSDATKVCFCNQMVPNCKNTTKKINKFPGETFSVHAVIVGQRNGITSGIVVAQFFNNKDIKLGEKETTYKVVQNCMTLNYTVLTNKVQTKAILSLDVPRSSHIVGNTTIQLEITPCPLGFELNNSTKMCECIKKLKDGPGCTTDYKIIRPIGYWIGYNSPNSSCIPRNKSKDIIVHRCPHLYCKLNVLHMATSVDHIAQDSQCSFYRQGLLCGQCKKGLSMVFGTPRCHKCTEYHWWAAFGITCAIGVAGILLVVFLIVCNFTVTEGTINGFILYANIIEATQDTYFPLKPSASKDTPTYTVLRTFIAWLNLDLGIETCYYNKMTTFDKTSLQFLFPIYIWLITGFLIWLSRRSALVTRLMKDNGTKVLATLILLSYAKLTRTIAACLSGVKIGESRALWLYDASLPYFYGRHLALVLTAVFFILLLLPYTLALLFIKPLPRLTNSSTFRWLNKLKPLFDAYTGPYKDKYRFWAGMQLCVRIFILIISTFANNTIILLVIAGVCTLLLSANYFYGVGIYKKQHVSIIEALLLLNLSIWSLYSVSVQKHTATLFSLAYIFAGLAFIQFWIVLLWFHVLEPIHAKGHCNKIASICWEKIKIFNRSRYTLSGRLMGRATYEELMENTSTFNESNNENDILT